jgi:hypothetical protein
MIKLITSFVCAKNITENQRSQTAIRLIVRVLLLPSQPPLRPVELIRNPTQKDPRKKSDGKGRSTTKGNKLSKPEPSRNMAKTFFLLLFNLFSLISRKRSRPKSKKASCRYRAMRKALE